MSRAPLSALHIELLADAGIDATTLTDEQTVLYAKLRLEAELRQVALVDAWETPNSVHAIPLGLAPHAATEALGRSPRRERAQAATDRELDSARRPRLAGPTHDRSPHGAPRCVNGHPKAEHQNPTDKSCRACRRALDAARYAARKGGK